MLSTDLKLKYRLEIYALSEEDGGGYVAEVPELPGCMTDGDTKEEAIEKAKDAIESWIEVAKETGRAIPEPKYYKEEDDYSGRITIRIPKVLHKELAETAEEQGVSINQLIVYYLSKSIGTELSAVKEETEFLKTFSLLAKQELEENLWKFQDPDLFMKFSSRGQSNVPTLGRWQQQSGEKEVK